MRGIDKVNDHNIFPPRIERSKNRRHRFKARGKKEDLRDNFFPHGGDVKLPLEMVEGVQTLG